MLHSFPPTGYTSITVALLVKQQGTEVSSFREAVDARFRFCVNSNMIGALAASYPEIAPYVIGVNKLEILDSIDQGLCEAAIMDADQWRNERLWEQTHHCDTKARLPDVVLTVPNAIVVRDDLAQVLSWAVRTEMEEGTYPAIKGEALLNYTAGLCNEASTTSRKESLGINDLGVCSGCVRRPRAWSAASYLLTC